MEPRGGFGPGRLYAADGRERHRHQPSPLQKDFVILRSGQAIRRDCDGCHLAAGGPAMNDVIAGHVALNMASIQVAKGLVETGKIKGLEVTSTERTPVLPNVPTLQEAGVKTADLD